MNSQHIYKLAKFYKLDTKFEQIIEYYCFLTWKLMPFIFNKF